MRGYKPAPEARGNDARITRSGKRLRIKMFAQRIHQYARSKPKDIRSREPCLIFCLLHRLACLLLTEMVRHQCQPYHFAGALGTHPTYGILVKLDHAAQRREGAICISLNGCCSSLVTEDHRLRHRTVNQAKRHRRVARMIEGALPLYEDPVVLVGKIEHISSTMPATKSLIMRSTGSPLPEIM